MKSILLKAIILSIFLASSIFANTRRDNKKLLMELKDCCVTVMKANMAKIETNKDGSRAAKGITPMGFAKQSFRLFKKLNGDKRMYLKSLDGSFDNEQLGHALATFLAASRIAIAKIQPKINTDTDGTINPKKFYPAIFGRLTANELKKRTGITIKQTTTGKGMGARNSKYNSPDAWEKKILTKIETTGWDLKNGVAQQTEQGYRYLHPLEITNACIGCHGDPRGEMDISGHKKEGYKLGDIRGGISVLIPQKAH